MKKIGVVTVARSDSGIYLPVMRAIQASSELQLQLIVAATHLSPEFGNTYRDIEERGFHIDERIEMTMSSDSPEGVAKSTGLGIISFAQMYSRARPDVLMILGDRFEMLAATTAALPFAIPVAHLHGGELSEGAIDDAMRHAITKMSHLHFATTEAYKNRVIQLGEEPWRVTHCGAPGLDNVHTIEPWSKAELEERLQLDLGQPTLLVTLHPVTLEYQDTEHHVATLLAALEEVGMQVVFTYPNSDTHGRTIIDAIETFVDKHTWARAVVNFGPNGYFGMLRHCAAMVGNSSSGIIESATFELPVVNIGNRQRGRIHSFNVVDVEYDRVTLVNAIRKVARDDFRATLRGMKNPYGDGHAAAKIVQVLERTEINNRLLLKRFHNITA